MAEIKSIKRFRGAVKGSITRLTRDIDKVINESSVAEIEGLHMTIKQLLQNYCDHCSQLYDLLRDEELSEEMATNSVYICEINTLLAKLNMSVAPQTPNSDKRPDTKTKPVKLPTLTLPVFDGDCTKWLGFWDLYKCTIHDNEDLSDIQKFTYLKGQLEGDAAKLIQGFSLETANYNSALNLLKNTYGDVGRIKSAYVLKLLNLPNPSSSVVELKQFYSSFECLIESLRSLNINLDELYTVLLCSKLPPHLQDIIKRSMGGDLLNLESFVMNFQNEIFNVEESQHGMDLSGSQFHQGNVASATFAVSSKETVDKGKFACTLCNQPNHPWYKCGKYKTNILKVNRANALKLCTGCLSAQHGSKGCTNPKVKGCFSCGKKHYYALCTEKGST